MSLVGIILTAALVWWVCFLATLPFYSAKSEPDTAPTNSNHSHGSSNEQSSLSLNKSDIAPSPNMAMAFIVSTGLTAIVTGLIWLGMEMQWLQTLYTMLENILISF